MTQLCIILAVFLISVIFGMVDMQVQSQRLQIIENTGNWHVAFTGIDDPTAVDISGRSVVRAAEWYSGIDETGNIPNKQFRVQLSPFCDMQTVIADITAQYQLSDEQVIQNAALMGTIGQSRNSFMLQLYGVAIVLFVLVLITGVLMISSSLNSNVMQRTEFFGMLRCIGATKIQVKRFVRREGLHWCITAIPIGVVAGIVTVWILCAALKAISPRLFSQMPMFGISWFSIAMGILVGIITVLLAARTPAKRAAKVSPLEAVSGNLPSAHAPRTATKIGHFKVDTALGIHYAKMSKKSFVLMVGSFAISIILFLSFSVIVDFMNHSIKPLQPWTPDISFVSEDNTCSIEHSTAARLNENENVRRAYGRMFLYDISGSVGGNTIHSNLISYEENQFRWAEDALFAGSLDDVIQNDNQVLAVYNESSPIQLGDILTLEINGEIKNVVVTGVLSSSPLDREPNTETLICSENTFLQLTGQTGYTIIDVQLKSEVTDEEFAEICDLVDSNVRIIDQRADNREARGMYYSFALFVYGFLAIIAIITIFNIVNTIGMSVSAKFKQYGIMRAIGMTNNQLVKMITSETFTYALWGSIVGCVLGLPSHWILYTSLITTMWGEPWKLPLNSLIIIIAIAIFATLLAVQNPARRIREMSVVNTINAS
jgi:putative ABC transport system permease protein